MIDFGVFLNNENIQSSIILKFYCSKAPTPNYWPILDENVKTSFLNTYQPFRIVVLKLIEGSDKLLVVHHKVFLY